MKKIIVIDTSIFCVWLKLPGFETCGPTNDSWTFERVNEKIEQEILDNSTLVLPLATIIETGNHISQCLGDRFGLATAFCNILIKSIDNENPWAAFSEQSDLWDNDNVKKLTNDWPKLAAQQVSIGDATIKDVADYYFESGWNVEILTGDGGLKSYEPLRPPTLVPRRRK